ncbi:hypothetical protein FB567DRAFT_615196 [Paraphoma chrysanthemicola]|uniref:Uncharacterized protein n=1 Tax=Paraphoma chrysanthemicola TaxID=798071 RepID=A0A8K0QTN6_9PLEO|nr:hypothetical protein FB567DRAFT_615196 [Paraphoma chrysanthemicola]
MATSLIGKDYTKAINELVDLYNTDQLDECLSEAQKLLEDPTLPRYHRIKNLILLANMVETWTEADYLRTQAEDLYRLGRRWHPIGEDTAGRLNEALKDEQPEGYILDSEDDEPVRADDEDIVVAQAMMDDLNIGELEGGE